MASTAAADGEPADKAPPRPLRQRAAAAPRLVAAALRELLLAEGYWAEWVTCALVAGVTYGVSARVNFTLRYEPVQALPGGGVVLDPQLSFPTRAGTVSGTALYGCVFGLPAALAVLAAAFQPGGAQPTPSQPPQLITTTAPPSPPPWQVASSAPLPASRRPAAGPGGKLSADDVRTGVREVHHVMLAAFEAWVIASCWKVWLNVGVGRQRPDWYAYLAAGGSRSVRHGGSESEDAGERFSYPSGHAAYSFSSGALMSWWLAGRWGVLGSGAPAYAAACERGQMARLALALGPLAVATAIAATRLTDYRHHFEDVNAGAAIGAAAGCVAYHCNFSGAWVGGIAGHAPRRRRVAAAAGGESELLAAGGGDAAAL